MNLVALLLLTLHLFIVSYVEVEAGQVIWMDSNITRSFVYMEAGFSPSVNTEETGVVYVAEPLNACRNLRNKPEQSPSGTPPFVLIIRGGCTFEYKVRNAQRSGFKAAIVYDNVDRNFLLPMAGDSDGIHIQAVFLMKAAGETLKKYAGLAETEVRLVPDSEDSMWSLYATIALIFSLATFGVMVACVFVCRDCTTHSNSIPRFNGMSRRMVKAMPSVTFSTFAKEDTTTGSSCAICLEDYNVGDKIRILPCGHKFHVACVDSWLISWRTFSPVCKRDAKRSIDEPQATERTPLLSSSIATSSVVCIDPPPLVSPVSFSPAHVSSSYIQQYARLSSHRSQSSPIHINRISENFRRQASPMGSSSQRSLGYSTMSPLNATDRSPYRPYLRIASPGLASSTNHLLCNYTAKTFPPSASTHSLPDC